VSAVDIVEACQKLNRCTQRLRLLHVDESVFEQTLHDTEPEVRCVSLPSTLKDTHLVVFGASTTTMCPLCSLAFDHSPPS
jgi:hypothetical protein